MELVIGDGEGLVRRAVALVVDQSLLERARSWCWSTAPTRAPLCARCSWAP
jgi:hypothetical protein